MKVAEGSRVPQCLKGKRVSHRKMVAKEIGGRAPEREGAWGVGGVIEAGCLWGTRHG